MMLPATDDIAARLGALLTYDASSPLIFSSGLFLFLFTGFLLLYAAFHRRPTARIVYVILFSLYFYYKSSGIYFLLLIFAAASDYWIARAIFNTIDRRTKRWLVALSVAVNLGMLAYFKYTNFFIEISNQLFGQGFLQFQNIFLPVGISFFVFQSMSYTIDVYRGRLWPLNNWLDYLFYLSFFPQLVAGPIVRARDFIPQIRQNPVIVTREMFGTGIFLILSGLFKKAVVSDFISLNFVDRVFDEPLLYTGFECLMGIYGYALQIYCDFSGYSDMAIGIALLLGFRFPKNFDAPLQVGHHHRVLAAVAHLALVVAARLPLHLARRQPQGPGADLRQSADYDDIGRAVARGRPAVRPLGRAARRGAGAPQTMDVARSGSQGDRGRDAPRMARSGHLADVQHSMLKLATVPR